MRPTYLWVLPLCLAAAACGKEKGQKPPGMPEGFERVNQAFGVKMDGLGEVDGRQRAPVVEFRSNGDYAMYPIATDCEGMFQRGSGLVYSSDGMVREQVTQQATETLDASPQFAEVVKRICTPYIAARAASAADPADTAALQACFADRALGGEGACLADESASDLAQASTYAAQASADAYSAAMDAQASADVAGMDAAQAVADAAMDAADAAEQSVARQRLNANELERRWSGTCESSSRQVATPAGSMVGLSVSEARQYCSCVWRGAGDTAALARGEALLSQPVAELLPQAHAICIQELM